VPGLNSRPPKRVHEWKDPAVEKRTVGAVGPVGAVVNG
jgi:hypothetical protein